MTLKVKLVEAAPELVTIAGIVIPKVERPHALQYRAAKRRADAKDVYIGQLVQQNAALQIAVGELQRRLHIQKSFSNNVKNRLKSEGRCVSCKILREPKCASTVYCVECNEKHKARQRERAAIKRSNAPLRTCTKCGVRTFTVDICNRCRARTQLRMKHKRESDAAGYAAPRRVVYSVCKFLRWGAA